MGDIHPSDHTSSTGSAKHLRATLAVPNPTSSHWQLPPHRLASHRSTASLPSEADIVVIGSGITAAFFCLELASHYKQHKQQQNAKVPKVVVLEARTLCSGATGRNGGHLIVDQLAAPHRRQWEERGYRDVQRVVQEWGDMGGECEWREVRGAMAWWSDGSKEWEGVKRQVQGDPGKEGIQGVDLVEDTEVLRKMDLKGDVLGAMISPWGSAATLCPYKLICGLWEELERNGEVNLQMQTPVLAVKTVLAEDRLGQHGVMVETSRGQIKAQHVVVATNGYVSQLLEQFTGLVVPTQGQMAALRPPVGNEKSGRLLKHDYGLHGLKGQTGLVEDYLVQRPWTTSSGSLMHGGARQWVKGGGEGVSDDSYNVDEAVEWLRDLPQRIDVGTTDEQLELDGAWTGIMGYSHDHCPWVGAVPGMEGVWVSAGYTGHGMPNAGQCGRHIARLVAAALDGEDWRDVQKEDIATGGMLEEFVVNDGRMGVAR